jgi:predicted DCC family thiol-disulfide oxidoreductase YuxK
VRGSDPAGERPQAVTLLFDGDCGFCAACADLLRFLDRHHRIRLVPFQSPGVCEALGLAAEECRQAAWASGDGGKPRRGAEAVLMGLGAAAGSAWLSRLYRHALLRRAADAVYGWVSAHRGRLPGRRPFCQRHPEECGSPSS